jgi:hypothetical protein
VQVLVLVDGVRGNFGMDTTCSYIRTLISGCEIPQLTGVRGTSRKDDRSTHSLTVDLPKACLFAE